VRNTRVFNPGKAQYAEAGEPLTGLRKATSQGQFQCTLSAGYHGSPGQLSLAQSRSWRPCNSLMRQLAGPHWPLGLNAGFLACNGREYPQGTTQPAMAV